MGGHIWAMALTPQQERFAQLCVSLCNYSAAYRQAYDCGDANFRTIATEASRLAADTEVAARIQQLRDEAATLACLPSLEERIKEQRELERANPDELIGLRWVNCRHCRGIDHAFQWRDELEYAQACDQARTLKQPTNPDMSGGFGYNGTLEPVATCTKCWGVGERSYHLADTSKLTGPAKRLYKGLKIKGNGDIEILLHDQQKATDMLNRIQGAYKDGNVTQQPAPGAATATAQAAKTPEERQRAYLRLVAT